MKKLIIALLSLIAFVGCGVGTYSLSSGKDDVAEISFVDNDSYSVKVKIDQNDTYDMTTVKEKAYKSGRNIKKISSNVVKVAVGKHFIEVFANNKCVYSKWVFVSAGEHKIIEL